MQHCICDQFFYTIHESHISILSKKCDTNILIMIQDRKYLLNKRIRALLIIKRIQRIVCHQMRDFLHQFSLYGFQHLIDICIVKIKCGAVDINFFYQFLYRNFLNTLLLHKTGKPRSQLCLGLTYSSVNFFRHLNPPCNSKKQACFLHHLLLTILCNCHTMCIIQTNKSILFLYTDLHDTRNLLRNLVETEKSCLHLILPTAHKFKVNKVLFVYYAVFYL